MRIASSVAIRLLVIAGILTLRSGATAAESEPTLTLSWTTGSRSYTRSELLKRPDVTRIEVAHDPAYEGKATTYQAVAFYALWKDVPLPGVALLQFMCFDGFSAPIAKHRVLNASPSAAIAYLAVEPPGDSWPANARGISPGPFYLVWKNPEMSGIQKEEWPFQLVAFEAKGTLAESYPAILPEAKAADSVQRGFKLFVQNCFPCHTMNKQGESRLGPDLNVPMSITRYWKPEAIRAQVRDPQQVRYWPEGRMPSFSKEQLSDEGLEDLIEYFKHMAGRRVE